MRHPDKIIQPYGTWESPITPLSLAGSLRMTDLGWDESGALVALEGALTAVCWSSTRWTALPTGTLPPNIR